MQTRELEKIGLDGKKAKIYLAVLELGRANIIQIARKTVIKRTTVYDVVLDLVNEGYLSEAKRGVKRIFIAEDPEVLKNIFEQRLDDVKEIIPALSEIYSKVVPRPKFKFYDGIEGVRHIMEESLNTKSKEQLYWGSIGDLVDIFGDRYMEQWVKRRVRRGIWSRCFLTSKTKISNVDIRSDENVLREVKWLSSKNMFEGVLCVFDNKVMYISSPRESFGFIVESNELSNFLRLIFRMMWSTPTTNL